MPIVVFFVIGTDGTLPPPPVYRLILDAGADVMAQDRWGSSPLFLASQTGNPNLINALLTAGADVGVCDVN